MSDPEYAILYRKIVRLNEIHNQITQDLNNLNDEVRTRLGTKVNILQQTLYGTSFREDP
jgi:hypothetical protein